MNCLCVHGMARLGETNTMSGETITVRLNGETREIPGGLDVRGLLQLLGIREDRVAVEINRQIVRREQWAEWTLQDGDEIEVVHFVGGGETETGR
ncbi:MAG TPA: sulfur carrier protein ThiS [Acidobacteriota bacterium]|nr:sulfur carrier protein ThiS [Acidobacteriota bacterium]